MSFFEKQDPITVRTDSILAGCVPSWNAFHTEKDVVFDRALVGAWSSPSAKETWEFTKGGEKLYQLQHTDIDGRLIRKACQANHRITLDT